MIWSLGVNLTQPLWNGTELEANLEQANIQTRLVALDYNRVLLNALQEVEAALSAETLLVSRKLPFVVLQPKHEMQKICGGTVCFGSGLLRDRAGSSTTRL